MAPHLKLKEEQEKVVRAIFEGKDVFVLFPTGFGKSVCFQVLPFVFDIQTRPCWWPEEECCCGGITSHRPDGRPGQECESPWCGGCDYLLWSTEGSLETRNSWQLGTI